MTSELKARAYEAMREIGKECFLRDARSDDALWASDLPRHTDALSPVQERLLALQVSCRLDEAARLWYLDLTLEGYRALTDGMPTELPPMPDDDRLHPAYALCRLLLLHPAPLDQQPLAPLRRVLKLAGGEKLLGAIPALHAECAARLREHAPLPHAAGRALAQWLLRYEHPSKEGQPL